MSNLRYTEIIKPLDDYVEKQTPKTKTVIHYLEGSLVVVLFTSLIFYV